MYYTTHIFRSITDTLIVDFERMFARNNLIADLPFDVFLHLVRALDIWSVLRLRAVCQLSYRSPFFSVELADICDLIYTDVQGSVRLLFC